MGKTVSFPVIFSDGKIEVNIPHVKVNPNTNFKSFEKLISKRTKLHPTETLIYFVPNTKPAEWSDHGPIFQILDVTDFRIIAQQRRYCFYVIPKMCMWEAMRFPSPSPVIRKFPVVLIPPVVPLVRLVRIPVVPVVPLVRLVRIPVGPAYHYHQPKTTPIYNEKPTNQCKLEEEIKGSFHPCANDKVVEFFKTKAGPIARPAKSSQTQTESVGWKLF